MRNNRRAVLLLALAALAVAASATAGGPVNWPALDPAFEGATFVRDDSVCADCHADSIEHYSKTRHARAFRLSGGPDGCESCHGPRSQHVEDPGSELAFSELKPAHQSAVCLQCHEGGSQMKWKSGAHHTADVSCSSCHFVMEQRSERALLAQSGTTDTCLSCHDDVRVDTMRTSHHPVREGRMDCTSCHSPHGSTSPALLRGNNLNETCLSCHAEKRGPFVWEHAPVRESCANCHNAHGSNNRNLLTSKDSFLCLQCHSYGGHINLPRYNRTSNPYGSGCVNCHITVHGSNHPSGAKLTR
jgi:DmsE family decaheme c-type cytochrome